MRIYIMRHGQAQPFAPSDEQRPLTTSGERQSEEMARWLADEHLLDTELDRVLVSPYLRAQQTWTVCQGILRHKSVIRDDSITPYGDAEQVAAYLRALVVLEKPSSLLLVSHLPLVGYLTAQFAPGITAPMFSTSAISCIELNIKTGKSEMLWLKTPRNLA